MVARFHEWVSQIEISLAIALMDKNKRSGGLARFDYPNNDGNGRYNESKRYNNIHDALPALPLRLCRFSLFCLSAFDCFFCQCMHYVKFTRGVPTVVDKVHA